MWHMRDTPCRVSLQPYYQEISHNESSILPLRHLHVTCTAFLWQQTPFKLLAVYASPAGCGGSCISPGSHHSQPAWPASHGCQASHTRCQQPLTLLHSCPRCQPLCHSRILRAVLGWRAGLLVQCFSTCMWPSVDASASGHLRHTERHAVASPAFKAHKGALAHAKPSRPSCSECKLYRQPSHVSPQT